MRKILIHRIWDMYCEYWRSNGILYEDSSSVLLLQGLLMMMMFSCQRETYDWTCFGGYELSLIIIIFHLVIGELEPEHTENLRNSKLLPGIVLSYLHFNMRCCWFLYWSCCLSGIVWTSKLLVPMKEFLSIMVCTLNLYFSSFLMLCARSGFGWHGTLCSSIDVWAVPCFKVSSKHAFLNYWLTIDCLFLPKPA